MKLELQNFFRSIVVVIMLSSTQAVAMIVLLISSIITAAYISGIMVTEDMMVFLNLLFLALKVLVPVLGTCCITYGTMLVFIPWEPLRQRSVQAGGMRILTVGYLLFILAVAINEIPDIENILSGLYSFLDGISSHGSLF